MDAGGQLLVEGGHAILSMRRIDDKLIPLWHLPHRFQDSTKRAIRGDNGKVVHCSASRASGSGAPGALGGSVSDSGSHGRDLSETSRVFHYSFVFDDGEASLISVEVGRGVMPTPSPDSPEWTRLESGQCENCPLRSRGLET